MDGGMRIDLDKLPIKRLEAIEENGLERFPPDIGPDEKNLDQIRRIDFSWAVERDAKKAKSSKDPAPSAATPWPWQSLVENLQLAHQELTVIVDLINTVEANDAVTVAGMTRPKPFPNEVLSDLSVSAATKLQRFRHLGRYFKQSSKALEQQVAREARFYGALIRLQQNWKVKRHRVATSAPSSEGFVIDLLDNSFSDPAVILRPSSMGTVHVDRDSSGMLTVQLPPKSCRFMHFGFLGPGLSDKPMHSSKKNLYHSREDNKEALNDEDVNECVKVSHSILREIHQAIFHEQVFDLVNRETLYQSLGVNVIGMREDLLQLRIGQEASVFLCLTPSVQDDSKQTMDFAHQSANGENGISQPDSLELPMEVEEQSNFREDVSGFPSPVCFEIYLQHIFHENMFAKAKEKRYTMKTPISVQPGDGCSLLSHFCLTIAHKIYSNKVLSELENLASGVPYLHLLTRPTWHSRMSSWSLSVKIPQLALHVGQQHKSSDKKETKNDIMLQFHTKIMVIDECINIVGEGAPSIVSSFGGNAMDACQPNCYGCDLADLSEILLQQVASQVIRWLHEEALVVGMKANRDFLCIYFELEEGNKIGLAAHVDPNDALGCISWWLVMDDGSMEEGKSHTNHSQIESENRKFLGHLTLEALYSTLMDLVSLCSSGGNV